jgi:hypothetical protein
MQVCWFSKGRTAAASVISSTPAMKVAGCLSARAGDLRGVSDGGDDPVPVVEQLLSQFAAEAAADAGDQSGTRCHGLSFRYC